MNRKCIYLAEGECEEKLIKALKEKPALLIPGKVKRFNVIQDELKTNHLVTFSPGSLVILVFDTDNEVTEHLKKNIENISQHMDSIFTEQKIEAKQYEFWLKFRDHCKLAILQRRHYNISKKTIEDLTSGIVKTETDRIQKDLTSQLIGLVSIFCCFWWNKYFG